MEQNIYKNAKIVVVDDVEEVLHSVKNCLEFEDMNVTCFNNPIDALEYLKFEKADVLLLDFFMPQMNGDEFVKKLRDFNQETIIILQTGYSDKIPPLEMIDKMNIQGYLDKLKGEDELLIMTKAAIKTSFLNKQIIEKNREISKLHFKKSISGNLITNIVNEAKDQLMQISGMNESIKCDTDEFQAETNVISNALSKMGILYNALNFEYEKNIGLEKLKEIIQILLRPNLLIKNSTLEFEESEDAIIENASDVIYAIIETTEILTRNDRNDIKIRLLKEDGLTSIYVKANNIDKQDYSNLELLTNNIKVDVEQLIIKI